MKHEITIRAVLNGFHVKVGCQQLAFESRKSLLRELERYLEDPVKVEKEYRENAIHKTLLTDPTVPTGYVTGGSLVFSNPAGTTSTLCGTASQ
jgi:hypothetical protein